MSIMVEHRNVPQQNWVRVKDNGRPTKIKKEGRKERGVGSLEVLLGEREVNGDWFVSLNMLI